MNPDSIRKYDADFTLIFRRRSGDVRAQAFTIATAPGVSLDDVLEIIVPMAGEEVTPLWIGEGLVNPFFRTALHEVYPVKPRPQWTTVAF